MGGWLISCCKGCCVDCSCVSLLLSKISYGGRIMLRLMGFFWGSRRDDKAACSFDRCVKWHKAAASLHVRGIAHSPSVWYVGVKWRLLYMCYGIVWRWLGCGAAYLLGKLESSLAWWILLIEFIEISLINKCMCRNHLSVLSCMAIRKKALFDSDFLFSSLTVRLRCVYRFYEKLANREKYTYGL